MRSRVPTAYDDGEPIPAEWNLHCDSCGYALTGLTSRRCPECGERFSPRDIWVANRNARTGKGETTKLLLFYGILTVLALAAIVIWLL